MRGTPQPDFIQEEGKAVGTIDEARETVLP
jgi:hypothetical protein